MVWKIISIDCLVFHWLLLNDLHRQAGEVTSESPNQTNPGFLPSPNWERQTRLCDDLQQRRAPQVFPLESRIPSPSEEPGFSSNICFINFSRHVVFQPSRKLPETLKFRVTHENPTQFLWLSECVELMGSLKVDFGLSIGFWKVNCFTNRSFYFWKSGLQVFGEFTVKSVDYIYFEKWDNCFQLQIRKFHRVSFFPAEFYHPVPSSEIFNFQRPFPKHSQPSTNVLSLYF